MFAVEIPRRYFYARFPGLTQISKRKADEMTRFQEISPQERVLEALAAMLPSSAAEIAEAAGLDAVTATACLDDLSARCRVMFNPLTKRYSLPRSTPSQGLAA